MLIEASRSLERTLAAHPSLTQREFAAALTVCTFGTASSPGWLRLLWVHPRRVALAGPAALAAGYRLKHCGLTTLMPRLSMM